MQYFGKHSHKSGLQPHLECLNYNLLWWYHPPALLSGQRGIPKPSERHNFTRLSWVCTPGFFQAGHSWNASPRRHQRDLQYFSWNISVQFLVSRLSMQEMWPEVAPEESLPALAGCFLSYPVVLLSLNLVSFTFGFVTSCKWISCYKKSSKNLYHAHQQNSGSLTPSVLQQTFVFLTDKWST